MNMTQLLKLNEKYQANLYAIRQLSLEQWTALAGSLGIAPNDRGSAARKLAIREMRIEIEGCE